MPQRGRSMQKGCGNALAVVKAPHGRAAGCCSHFSSSLLLPAAVPGGMEGTRAEGAAAWAEGSFGSPASTRASPAPRARPRSGSRALLPGSSVPSARNGISTEPCEPQRLGHGYSEHRGPACPAPAPPCPAGTAEPTKNPTEPTANVQPPGPNSTCLNFWLLLHVFMEGRERDKKWFPPGIRGEAQP